MHACASPSSVSGQAQAGHVRLTQEAGASGIPEAGTACLREEVRSPEGA